MADNTASERHGNEKLAAASLSLCSNTLLTILKLTVGILTGSVSVISEGAHSAADLLASGIAVYTVRMADLPPDEAHPYGHGKMESLSALMQAAFLFGVAGYIIYEAVDHLIRRAAPQRLDWGLGVMALAAVINAVIVRIVVRVGQRTDSEALLAAAQDHRADIFAALGVFIGLALVWATGWAGFDPLLAIAVALLILRGAWRVVRGATTHLVDRKLPEQEIAAIRGVFDREPGVRGYHKLRTRKAGSMRHVDAHVLMDDNLSLLKAHDLTEQLETRIREALPNTVVHLHTEPYHAEERHQREEHGGPPPDEQTKE